MAKKTWLSLVIVMAYFPIYAQYHADSVVYWVNKEYLECINKGKPVCQCGEQNRVMLLHVNSSKNKIIIQPFISINKESISANFKVTGSKTDSFLIVPSKGWENDAVFTIKENELLLSVKNSRILFSPLKTTRLDNVDTIDIQMQLGKINCGPLLAYSTKPCKDAHLLISERELTEWAGKGWVNISCTGNSPHHELIIKNHRHSYFLVYTDDEIKLYKQPEKGDPQTLDISVLNECQVFYKVKSVIVPH